MGPIPAPLPVAPGSFAPTITVVTEARAATATSDFKLTRPQRRRLKKWAATAITTPSQLTEFLRSIPEPAVREAMLAAVRPGLQFTWDDGQVGEEEKKKVADAEDPDRPLNEEEVERFKELAGRIQNQRQLSEILCRIDDREKRSAIYNQIRPFLPFKSLPLF